MGSWQTLFATQAGAGAALTGLVFVALSINLKEILALPGLADRAGEALLLLMFPVVNGLVGVLPQTSSRALGAEFLVIAIFLWSLVTRILFTGRNAVRGRPPREFITPARSRLRRLRSPPSLPAVSCWRAAGAVCGSKRRLSCCALSPAWGTHGCCWWKSSADGRYSRTSGCPPRRARQPGASRARAAARPYAAGPSNARAPAAQVASRSEPGGYRPSSSRMTMPWAKDHSACAR